MPKSKLNIEQLEKQMLKQYEQDILILIDFQENSIKKVVNKDLEQYTKMDGLHKIIANQNIK